MGGRGSRPMSERQLQEHRQVCKRHALPVAAGPSTQHAFAISMQHSCRAVEFDGGNDMHAFR